MRDGPAWSAGAGDRAPLDFGAFDDAGEAACARCRRSTPVDALRLWTTRERVRTLARAATPPPAEAPSAPFVLDGRPQRPVGAALAEAPRPGAPASGAFRRRSVTRVDAVCLACHRRLSRGAALDGPDRRRMWLTLGVFLAG